MEGLNKKGTMAMPKDWNIIEEIYEDTPPGLRKDNAREISRRMGSNIIDFLQAHPDQYWTLVYRVSSCSVSEFLADRPSERRHHRIEIAAVEELQILQPTYEDLPLTVLFPSAINEIKQRIRSKWLRFKFKLRRQ